MPNKKGFSLIEIIAVTVIAGVIIAISIPSYFYYVQQGAANNAQNNLTAIYNAEKTYYLNNGSYCVGACANSLGNINTNLNLNLIDTTYSYSCVANGSSGFSCGSTSSSSGSYSACGGTGVAANSTPINGTCSAWSCSAGCNSYANPPSQPGQMTLVSYRSYGTAICTSSTPAQCGGLSAVGTSMGQCVTHCSCTSTSCNSSSALYTPPGGGYLGM